MNPACASEIVKYLHVSGSPEVDFSRLKVSHDHWKRTLEWLDHSGIALLFWNRLKVRGDAAAIPSEVAERLERNLADHRLRLSEMAAEFDSINQCFEGARLKYAAMKGLALAPDYCPDIALRTTYDYDYLLPRGSMQAAEEALRSAGYVWKRDPEEHPVVYCHAARPPCNPLSRDDLYSKDFPRTVELHYLFWDAAPVKIPLALPADPLADLEIRHVRVLPNHPGPSRPGRPLHFYTLSEDNDLIFQVLHAFRHILHGWCRLCSLLDVAYFLEHRRLDAAFWDRFIGRLRDNRPLSEIVGVVFLLAARLFGATIPESVSDQIIRGLRQSIVLWVERYGLDSALSNFSDNKFALFLHREFIRDDADWRAIQRSRLFPMHQPNHAVEATGSTVRSRFAAGWRQQWYVAQRLKHHLMTTVRYALESNRWCRECNRAAADPHFVPAADIGLGTARQRILFLEQQSWRCGAERVLDEAVRALAPEFLPLVAFPEDGPFAAELRGRNIETLLFPLGRYRAGPKSFIDMMAFPARSLYCALRLARIIRQRQIDVVYINSPRCLIAGLLAARLTARPSLFHLHMCMTRRADLLVATWAARYVTKVIACSKTAAAALAKADPRLHNSIEVIHNPVRKPVGVRGGSPEAIHLAGLRARSAQAVVGLVGRVTPQKGHHVLIKAAAGLARHGRGIEIVFVGAPDRTSNEDMAYVRRLETLSRDLGMEDKVHWAGYQEDPNTFYAMFDVLVIPSTVSEGLPLVALEAMQWGVPVIGTRVGGIPEVVFEGMNGLLVRPGDDEELATCLERVLENGDLRARLQAGARSSVDGRYSVDSFRTSIRKVLFELCPAFRADC